MATEPRADFVRLFLLDPARGWALEPLDSSVGGEPFPRISPDGDLVAIPVEQGFRLLDVATRRVRTVTADSELTGDWIQVSFAPDGQSVVGSVLGHGGSANVVVESDLAGGTRILWRSTDEVVFEVLRSPDGARIAVRKKSFASELLLLDFAR